MKGVRSGASVGVDLHAIHAAMQKVYPETPAAVIEVEVAEAARSFRNATVADFLPVLIERQVKSRLRGTAPSTGTVS